MSAKLQTAKKEFFEKLRLLRGFGAAQSLLSWDRETHMPLGASADRGETMAVLAGSSHQLFTDKKFVSRVEYLFEQQEELSPEEKRTVELTKKELDKSVKLSTKFVEDTNQLLNAAHSAWLEAKANDDFALFEPHLKAVVENRKQYADFLDTNADAYDVNLDDYEEGLNREMLLPIFDELKKGLKDLLQRVLETQKQSSNPFNNVVVDHRNLEAFLREMITTIGFDFQRGATGKVEHPFEISISHNDVRLNTKFTKEQHSFTIMGMIHELGHGLYEQNIDAKYVSSFLDHGVSLGIHESQSRFLENILGRSTEFWSFFLPKLQAHCPEFKNLSVEQVVNALNTVQPSLIRTESDEVTYNLHILLRFELEDALMHNKIKVKDLPEVWKVKIKELVGVEPATDGEGVLQDVHWSWGNIGYFPTYTLGNLNAAQLFAAFVKTHPHWRDELRQGNFTSYFSWFKNAVWQYGSFRTPSEIMVSATGEDTQAEYFLSYLKGKYLG